MPGNCRKASEVNLAVFLAEPQSREWEEFRQHALYCEACSAKVFQWTQLGDLLQSAGRNAVATHPAEELLAQFHNRRESLAEADRLLITQHLQICPACREELSLLASFNFTLIQKWIEEEQPGQTTVVERPVLEEFSLTRFLEALRSLILHPAFAYGIALLLGIRVVSSDFLPHPFSGPALDISPSTGGLRAGSERSGSPGSISTVISSSLSPQEAAVTVLEAYKTAYEARDMSALDHLWKMSGEWHTTIEQLFEESRRLSLVFDVQSVRVNDQESRVSVEFAQVTTVLSKEGRFYTKGPVSYIADIGRRGDSSGWEIENLQPVPD
ncbi:MAG: hypothetical protein HY268_04240 [Deltaproteobacteria bacterium]|nr:hypothetical protein [Deltaproteobacteria bacterium]